MTHNVTVIAEKLAAEHGWTTFLKTTLLNARIDGWEQTSSEAGELLSARATGPLAAVAVRRFAAAEDFPPVMGRSQRPSLDCSVPGRIGCVWQSNGVWLEIWADDAPATPSQPSSTPSTAAPAPKAKGRPSYRFPFTRRRKETNPA